MTTSIIIADDHLVFLEGMKTLLHNEGYDVVGQATDGHQAVKLARSKDPHIAILDISMPKLNGLDAAQKIRKQAPKTRVIVLTMHRENAYVAEALRAGASGYVLKSQAAQDILVAIRFVAAGKVYLSPGVSQLVVDACDDKVSAVDDPLSVREREVLQLIAEGRKTKQVADILGISVKTAESHRSRIMKKLDIHETAGLVRYAIRNRLVQP